MRESIWIVVWVEREERPDTLGGRYTDKWDTFETREDAQKRYDALVALDSTYTASICRPIVSTDYPTED
jgi:hypothetical protein